MDSVYPVIKVVIPLLLISWLRSSAQKAVWPVKRAGYMECQNGKNPTIYTGAWFQIGVGEHSFDISSVYFDDKVADTYEVKLL